jgi:riboflavin synthase
MFTGLIEEIGLIKGTSQIGRQQFKQTISCDIISGEVKSGDSVAVDGVCLTVVGVDRKEIQVDISSETSGVTLLSKKSKGTKVNLERALKMGDRLDGHIVQGHVDGISQLIAVKNLGNFYDISFSLDSSVKKYCIHKGSIAVNGISLTISALQEESFTVAIIPQTYTATTMSDLRAGDRVHIETDMIARYVERLLPFQNIDKNSGLTPDFLKQHGF